MSKMTGFQSLTDRNFFVHLCNFIELEDKFARLIHLNKQVTSSFDVSTCCKRDTLYILIRETCVEPFEQTIERCLQQLKLLSSVHHVVIHFDRTSDTADYEILEQVKVEVVEAMTVLAENDNLESLTIKENDHDISLATEFLDALLKINKPRPSLKKFHWQGSDAYERYDLVDWSSLSLCKSLESMIWRFNGNPEISDDHIRTMLRSFPPSLLHLKIQLQPCAPNGMHVEEIDWNTDLRNNAFLPNLLTFHLEGEDVFFEPSALTNTVMQETNKVRSIEFLGFQEFEEMDSPVESLLTLNSITALSLQCITAEWISSIPYDALPKLRMFELLVEEEPELVTSTEALLEFLSRRPVESLSLNFFVLETEEQLRFLSGMKQLKTLDLSGNPHGFDPSLLPASSWPELLELNGAFEPATMESVLRAAPALRKANLACDDASVFALVGRYCPSMQSLTISDWYFSDFAPESHSNMLASLRESFAEVDPTTPLFQNLIYLNIREWCWGEKMIGEKTMHFILSKLKDAPLLSLFLYQQAKHGESRSLMEYMIVRDLPRVRELLPADRHLDIDEEPAHLKYMDLYETLRSGSSTEFEYLEPARVPAAKWDEWSTMEFENDEPSIDLALHEPSDVTAASLDEYFTKLARTDEQELLAQVHASDRGYLRFRAPLPGSHLDGRARFLAALGKQQIAEDTAQLDEWDEGNYGYEDEESENEEDEEDFDEEDEEDFEGDEEAMMAGLAHMMHQMGGPAGAAGALDPMQFLMAMMAGAMPGGPGGAGDDDDDDDEIGDDDEELDDEDDDEDHSGCGHGHSHGGHGHSHGPRMNESQLSQMADLLMSQLTSQFAGMGQGGGMFMPMGMPGMPGMPGARTGGHVEEASDDEEVLFSEEEGSDDEELNISDNDA